MPRARRKAPNVDFVNPFIEATCQALRSMLGLEVVRGSLYIKRGAAPSHEVSGVISFFGAANGVIVLGMSARVAIEATRILAGERPRYVDEGVVDAIGKLANIIASQAKSQLEQLELSITSPQVLTGRDHELPFPEGAVPIGIPFQSPYGVVSLEVSLVEVVQNLPA